MKADLLIKNVQIVTDASHTQTTCIQICNGKITTIGDGLSQDAERVLDGSGLTVLPGCIDAQVHFRDPGMEHKEDLYSGSRAAIAGGVTSFLEMPNTRPPTTSQQALDAKLARADQVSLANYGFFIGATGDNLEDINAAAPCCAIKVFMGSSTGTLLVDDPEKLEAIFATGTRMIAVHAEDEARLNERIKTVLPGREQETAIHSTVRDATCALLATQKARTLAEKYRRDLHVLHLSTAEEVDYLRDKPSYISCEVTPAHLFLDEGDYETFGSLVQMNPPVRSAHNRQALWQGLLSGTIDFMATDHAPHLLSDKELPYPKSASGMPQVEWMLPLMLTAAQQGRCSLAQVRHWLCHKPAERYGLIGKGRLEVGYDADLCLVDLKATEKVADRPVRSRCGWSPFANRTLSGWPRYTLVAGHTVYAEGQLIDNPLPPGRRLRYGHFSQNGSRDS